DYQIFLLEIITSILRVAKESGSETNDFIGSGISSLTEINKFNNMGEAKQWIITAKEYIRSHYEESDISIGKVCQHLHISTGYFSSIFKKEMKMTFVSYLLQIRLEAAKEMLRSTELKAFEIAEKIAVTVAVAVIVSIMLYGKFANTAEENANLNMQQIIEQVNYNLELYVKGMGSIFETAEKQITTSQSIDSPLLYERMDTLMSSREDLVSVAVFTPQGQYVVGTPGQSMRLNTQLESQSWFTTAKRTSEISYSAPHIQNLFKGRYTWVVSISKMIQYREKGELKTGILLLDFNFRTIDELSRQVKLGKRGYAYILDPLGNIVYHPQQQLIYAGLKYENVEPVLEYSFRSYLDESTGEKRFITVRTLAQTGWKIVGVAYYDEIVTTKRDLNQFLAWFLAVVLVCVIAVSVFLSWLIASPIRKLERTVKQVGEGDLNTPINVSGAYEVEQLSKRFNMMLQRIRQLMDQIIYEQETKRKG
ncbi:hypothetical protein KC345_g11478, partial [Hortaea werneckii]